MTGCKHSLWTILSVLAAVAVVLPRMALGEFGVCPPYSKTFGPDDPPEEILAFINEINLRPGGGTLILEPGVYEPGSDFDQDFADLQIAGVVCIRSTSGGSEAVEAPWGFTVGSSGVLTLKVRSGSAVGVSSGGTLFAENQVWGYPSLGNDGVAYVRDSIADGVENSGTLVWRGGGVEEFGNSGWALFDQVQLWGWVHCPTVYKCVDEAPAVSNGGVLTVHRSVITEGCGDADGDLVCSGAISNSHGASVYVVGSTVDGGIVNDGGTVEIGQSISDGCATVDAGYNVFSESCPISQPTSVEADPLFMPDSFELSGASPAIDRIPLALCAETDMLGRARTDGNGDGDIACDSGALEYGYASVEVVVRSVPYWRSVGRVDLSSDSALFIAVMSGGPIDPTSIVFDSIVVGDFPRSAMRGGVYADKNGDGLSDYNFWYRLDRDLVLECRYYDEPFTAMTDDGQRVTGRLQFEVIGCTP